MLWVGRHALDTNSILVSWDVQGHLLRARHAAGTLSLRSGFTAWFPSWHGGFPLPEVYPPLTTWLLGIFVALGIDSLAMRITLLGAWIAVVPCSYYFLRSFDVDRWPAAVGSCLSVALNANWTFGAYAIFSLGLLPNAFGFLLAILSLGSARRLVGGFAPPQAIARTALLGGLTILAHPFAASWMAAAWLVLGLTRRFTDGVGGASARPLVNAGVWSLAIGSFYWLPFLANHHNLLATEPFFPTTLAQSLRSIALLRTMGGPAAVALAIAGLAGLALVAHHERLFVFSALLLVGAILTTGLFAPIFPFASTFGQSQWVRFEGFYGWTALMIATFSLDAARAMAPAPRWRPAFISVAVLIVLGTALLGLRPQRQAISLVTPVANASLDGVAAQLNRRLQPGEFLLTENAIDMAGVLGSPHFFNQLLPRINPVFWDQGGSLPEGTAAAERFFEISRDFPELMPGARDDLADGGVRFLVTARRESRDALDQIPWLKRLWADERVNGVALYEVAGFDRRFGLPADLSGQTSEVEFTPRDGYQLTFAGEEKLTYPVTTALAFHPWLTASADAEPVSTSEGNAKRLVLTSGPATASEIVISYEPPRWIAPIRVLALLALFLALVIGRPRRRTALEI